jgi:hydroxymethylpyrimidine pyrophosphatase-like HAD family hydrolase
MIGVGDGHNDLPLFEACGFRVAMGNADEELKKLADYIAPSVEDDGIVDVIEKFIL